MLTLLGSPVSFSKFFRAAFFEKIKTTTSEYDIHNPANIYLFKVNKRKTKKSCEICSMSAIKTPKRRHWRRAGVFIVNFEHISNLVLVFLLLTLNNLILTGKILHNRFVWNNFAKTWIPFPVKLEARNFQLY